MLSVCRAAERPGPAGCRARVLHAASPSVSGLFSELLLLLFVPQVASMPRPRLAVNSEAKKGETQNRAAPSRSRCMLKRQSQSRAATKTSQESSKARLMPSTSAAAGLGGLRAVCRWSLG